MTSKVILAIVALIFILVGVVPLLVKKQVGDVRPAILPPKQIVESPVSTQSAGQPVEFPLKVPKEFSIGVFSKGLGVPRDLEFSPGGVLLASVPKEGKVVALPDTNNDGIADKVINIISGLERVHGIVFYKGQLFAAGEAKVIRYNWNEAQLSAVQDKEILSLPSGGRHFTRAIVFNKSGQMFVSIGSTCDVCVEKNPFHGSVIVSDSQGNDPRIYAKGLRNAVFITVNPETDELWGTEMGRDFLGDNLPPDEINIIKDEGDYGWPFCYGNKVKDIKFSAGSQARPCEATEAPVFEIPAHSAPLGLAFVNSKQFPTEWQGDLLVSYHGSWNSSIPVGYKVVRMDVEGNTIKGSEDFITGFLDGAEALARPVDLIFDKAGSLYISDDKAGYIFKIVGRPF